MNGKISTEHTPSLESVIFDSGDSRTDSAYEPRDELTVESDERIHPRKDRPSL
jgi:hypothetical protein